MRFRLGRHLLAATPIGAAAVLIALPSLAGATRYVDHHGDSYSVIVKGNPHAIRSAKVLFEPKAITCPKGGEINVAIPVAGPVGVKNGRFRASGERQFGEDGTYSWVFRGRFQSRREVHGSVSVLMRFQDAGVRSECWTGTSPSHSFVQFSAKAASAK